MRKYILMIGVLFVSGLLLIACGEENRAFPEDVIKDAEADPIELEDQMGLEIGDTGYIITQSEGQPLVATLNSVGTTQDIGAESVDGDDFYMIADFTFKNVGDGHLAVDFPDVAAGTEESAILNDELGRGDRLGLGTWYLDENEDIDSDNPTNSIGLDPGEEENHKIALSMRGSADEYIIYFGFFASGNRDYQNKAGWTIQSEQLNQN